MRYEVKYKNKEGEIVTEVFDSNQASLDGTFRIKSLHGEDAILETKQVVTESRSFLTEA